MAQPTLDIEKGRTANKGRKLGFLKAKIFNFVSISSITNLMTTFFVTSSPSHAKITTLPLFYLDEI